MKRSKPHRAMIILFGIVAIIITGEFNRASADLILSGVNFATAESTYTDYGATTLTIPTGGSQSDLFLTSGSALDAPFINGPDNANAAISMALTPGNYTFGFWTYFDGAGPIQLLNLFFGGSDSPSISVSAPLNQTYPGTSSFTAYSGPDITLDMGGTSGSGSLSYSDGSLQVTLTDFQAYLTTEGNVQGSDPRVSQFSTTPDGNGNFFGEFSINVAEVVPEPSTWLLMSIGLPIAIGLQRRHVASRKDHVR